MTHQPSTHWDSELRFKLQFIAQPIIQRQPAKCLFILGNTAQWELRPSTDLLPHYAVLPLHFSGAYGRMIQ